MQSMISMFFFFSYQMFGAIICLELDKKCRIFIHRKTCPSLLFIYILQLFSILLRQNIFAAFTELMNFRQLLFSVYSTWYLQLWARLLESTAYPLLNSRFWQLILARAQKLSWTARLKRRSHHFLALLSL